MTALSWPGCENARDLGGLPTASGGRIRKGALIRSDRPRPAGVEAVLAHDVRLVIDLRLAGECAADPSPLAGHPAYRNLSVLRDEDDVLEAMADTMPDIYRAILDRGADRMAAVITAIALAPPGGVLVHCHSGRDRTGLVVALALTLAGVPDREIARDYALTASCTRPGAGDRSRRLFNEITEATMLRTLEHLRERHGGAVPYLGIDESVITSLRTRLTEPQSR
ncbi:protein-tyrosine-phosphatase [Nonomuraea phyllanthi]|uniref:Protein-tyrosine-phosphatase n=1 Tax=Nonomuraea phyllanthi TaxID=2219224 RepID=A0A5C4WX77_9ACTN|nr:tyrosine-protein phosphatase [Nonomuraea phyllanthi]KAB8197812.1 protein-tyrosine-phosphatase [Nonomuraea phyllanthi]QFY06210.1 protein-tyrosine-phosphatase [Nonomuraea phyllanthi]